MFSEVNSCFQRAHNFCMNLQPVADPYNVVWSTHMDTAMCRSNGRFLTRNPEQRSHNHSILYKENSSPQKNGRPLSKPDLQSPPHTHIQTKQNLSGMKSTRKNQTECWGNFTFRTVCHFVVVVTWIEPMVVINS